MVQSLVQGPVHGDGVANAPILRVRPTLLLMGSDLAQTDVERITVAELPCRRPSSYSSPPRFL